MRKTQIAPKRRQQGWKNAPNPHSAGSTQQRPFAAARPPVNPTPLRCDRLCNAPRNTWVKLGALTPAKNSFPHSFVVDDVPKTPTTTLKWRPASLYPKRWWGRWWAPLSFLRAAPRVLACPGGFRYHSQYLSFYPLQAWGVRYKGGERG